jgi:HEAT repeat protein
VQDKENRAGGTSFDQFMEMLSSPDHFDRAEAARQICNMGKTAVKALPALLALHNDSWYQVRIQVPRAIIHMEARLDEVAEVLNRLLRDDDETVRLYAKEAQRVLTQRMS